MINKILLVEPNFPIPSKSKNHSNFLPIGLLKLASYYRSKGHKVELVRGTHQAKIIPNKIIITSLFTYWSKYVKEAVFYFRKLYPKAKIIVGGIYATLMPKHCKEYTSCDEVFVGQHKSAEKVTPAYDLVGVDYQIIHGMRGCSNKCPFCGIWRIENKSFKTADQIKKEIMSNNLIFYDNNILVNPHIEEILKMLANIKFDDKVINCECQSGFDGRILMKKPHLAKLLKKARFKNIRVAWDFPYTEASAKIVKSWIKILTAVGYKSKDIFVFMIYNWKYGFNQLEKKREKCYEMGVQIADCRFRPLDSTFDNYNPRKKEQNSSDYYISKEWTDKEIRQFRRNVRKQNICIRYKIPIEKYDNVLERTNSKRENEKVMKGMGNLLDFLTNTTKELPFQNS